MSKMNCKSRDGALAVKPPGVSLGWESIFLWRELCKHFFKQSRAKRTSAWSKKAEVITYSCYSGALCLGKIQRNQHITPILSDSSIVNYIQTISILEAGISESITKWESPLTWEVRETLPVKQWPKYRRELNPKLNFHFLFHTFPVKCSLQHSETLKWVKEIWVSYFLKCNINMARIM